MSRSQLIAARIYQLMGRRRARPVVRWLWRLHEYPFRVVLSVELVLIALVTWVDTIAVHNLSVILLYLIPVGIAAWWGRFAHGMIVAAGCGVLATASGYVTHAFPVGAGHVAVNMVSLTVLLVVISYLLTAISRILRYEQSSSHTDPLTGLANRRLLREYFRAESERARRYGHTLSVMFMDVDNFKTVNDRHGHAEGDRVLRSLAWVLTNCTRDVDTPARLGGDEFALIMPETGEEGIRGAERRIRRTFLGMAGRHGWPVGLSIGGVVYHRPPMDVDESLAVADELLYSVKREGKNATRVITRPASPGHDPVHLVSPSSAG